MTHRRNGRGFLPDRNVHAAYLLGGVTALPVRLLVQNGIDRNRGFTGLTVTDNQLTLATANRDHRVNSFQAGLQRLMHRLTLRHTGCLQLQCAAAFSLNRPQIVNGVAEGVNDAAQVLVANGYRQHLTSAVYLLAFLNTGKITQDDHTNIAGI